MGGGDKGMSWRIQGVTMNTHIWKLLNSRLLHTENKPHLNIHNIDFKTTLHKRAFVYKSYFSMFTVYNVQVSPLHCSIAVLVIKLRIYFYCPSIYVFIGLKIKSIRYQVLRFFFHIIKSMFCTSCNLIETL